MTRPDSRHIRTKSDAVAVDEGCYYDQSAVDHVISFIGRFCKQSIGQWAGKPLRLLPWQVDGLVGPLYGWRRPTGERRHRQASVWIPKNNGKSTLCSALSLYELVGKGEPGAQVINLAATIEQAGIVFRGACDMIDQAPALSKHLQIFKHIKTVEFRKSRSMYRVMSGDSKGKHGFSISCLIVDELAEQQDRELWDTMRHNCGKRPDSVLVSISTAGYKRESIGYEQFCYAQKVLAGEIIDTAFLPLVYAADPAQPWDSVDTFVGCNPSAGVTIDLAEVKEAIVEARNEPRKESAYRTLRLNQWVGHSTSWIPSQAWAECAEEVNENDFHGRDAWIGYDSSFRHDLASYVVVVERDGVVYLLPRFFSPAVAAEVKERKDRVPYLAWARNPATHMYLTPGEVIDPSFVRAKILEDCERFKVQEIGFDPAGGSAEETRQILERETGVTLVSVPQRAKYLGQAASTFERLIKSKGLRHPKNPVLSWCLENCTTKETPEGIYVMKGQGETQRIDGIIAALIGMSRWLVREENALEFWVGGT